MLRKLLIVYNPRSSQHARVQREVLEPTRQLKGWLVGKYELKPTDVDDNAETLAKLLNDGDLVVGAGGDGTAAVAVNGIMLSGKEVTFSMLGYGNFNDTAKMLKAKLPVEYGGEYLGGILDIVQKFEQGEQAEIYPLEAIVDGVHWRYAPCYITVGMFAESTRVLNATKVRKQLKTGKKHLFFSLWQLAKWYFWNKRRRFLPMEKSDVTDYLAVNSPRVAKIMKGDRQIAATREFWSGTARLGSFWRLMWFMLESICWRMPLEQTKREVIKFEQPSRVIIQAEGESEELSGVREIEVQKTKRPLRVVKM